MSQLLWARDEELALLIAEQAKDIRFGDSFATEHGTVSIDNGPRLTRSRDRHPKEKAAIQPDDVRHGTYAGYKAGCREECCRAAMSGYRRSVREAKKAPTKLPRGGHKGSLNQYTNYGCRCWRCRRVAAKQAKEHRDAKRLERGPKVYF